MRHAVILAGGGGTRLWPASRRALPKQFLTLGTGPLSLLTSTANRLASVCEDRLYVVTAADQVEQVQAALPELSRSKIIAEPSARNTAAALGLSAVHLLHRDPDAIMAAIPSDQHIGDEEEFRRVLSLAFATAETEDAIVTVGIVPIRPETGYGYLKLGAKHNDQVSEVAEFVEKPDSETAQRYLESGEYLWNGGMFITKAARLLSEIERLMPETYKGLKTIADAMSEGRGDEVCARVYPELPSISIDYGVMEKTSPVLTIAGDFQWNHGRHCPTTETLIATVTSFWEPQLPTMLRTTYWSAIRTKWSLSPAFPIWSWFKVATLCWSCLETAFKMSES